MEDLKEAMSSGEVGKVEWLLQQPDVVSQLRGNEEMQRALLFDGIKKGHTDAALKVRFACICYYIRYARFAFLWRLFGSSSLHLARRLGLCFALLGFKLQINFIFI